MLKRGCRAKILRIFVTGFCVPVSDEKGGEFEPAKRKKKKSKSCPVDQAEAKWRVVSEKRRKNLREKLLP